MTRCLPSSLQSSLGKELIGCCSRSENESVPSGLPGGDVVKRVFRAACK